MRDGIEPNDTILMFVSGHGFHEDQDYYYRPTDAEFARAQPRKSTAVPWDRFQSMLKARAAGASCSSTPAAPATATASG